MNQSFDLENFVKIYYDENRKGNYVEGEFNIFRKVKNISYEILSINEEFRQRIRDYKNKIITGEDYVEFKLTHNKKKDQLIKEKHKNLEIALKIIEEKISQNDFDIELDNSKTVGNKPVYTINRIEPEPFFILKQLQKNIQVSFKVKQSDRYEIINQVKNMLDNSFPKYVIRTDIKNFYESIPHDKLKEKIMKNYILSSFSKKILYRILHNYKCIVGIDKGIPRGIGVSSYLSELYMRDIDSRIKLLPNVTYYARYVDDIIMIITPKTKYDDIDYLNKIKDIVGEYELELNEEKTKEFDLASQDNKSYNLDFLGYRVYFSNKSDDIKILFTTSKINKIKLKLNKAFDDYKSASKYNEKQARKLLIKRIKFLTGNTRLLNVKKDILIGIYFSNIFLTETDDLVGLDKYFGYLVNNKLKPYKYREVKTAT